MLKSHSIYIRIWNSYTCFAELVHESFWYNNMHCTIDFCTDQPGRNPMYQSLSADMVLLSNLCSMVLGLIHPTFFKTSNHVGESTNICNSLLEFLRHRKSSIKIFGKLASLCTVYNIRYAWKDCRSNCKYLGNIMKKIG